MSAPKSVMIVDDEPHVLVMVAVMLRKAGYAAIAAESAEMAMAMLEELARNHRLPSAILSDIHMDGMSGAAFAECLYADPTTAAIPVVVVTGRLDGEDDRLTPNVVGIVRKPFTRRTLIDELQRALDGGRVQFGEAA